jgi:hypothetical protein
MDNSNPEGARAVVHFTHSPATLILIGHRDGQCQTDGDFQSSKVFRFQDHDFRIRLRLAMPDDIGFPTAHRSPSLEK